MSELFLLLDQLLGLAWIFPTLHRNYVSIQRPQKPCLRKQLRAAHRQSASASASLTIDNTNRRGRTSNHTITTPSLPPLARLLVSCIFFMCLLPFASLC
jgi:hypothetical protein